MWRTPGKGGVRPALTETNAGARAATPTLSLRHSSPTSLAQAAEGICWRCMMSGGRRTGGRLKTPETPRTVRLKVENFAVRLAGRLEELIPLELVLLMVPFVRSEERRVGKEGGARSET